MQRRHEMTIYGEIKLFAGTASPMLAERIAKYLNTELCDREVILFPNDNLFIKLGGSVRGQDVYVIQTTGYPVQRNLMELLIMLQSLRMDSAARITAVVPYLCYGRSDKKDQPRVPITARLVADMIEVAGADRYMTLDPHAGQVQGFFSIPGDVLTVEHMMVDHINADFRNDMKDPVVVAVDLGFAKKGRNFAADLGVPISFIEKRRVANDSTAKALTLIGDVTDRDVIIVDDEIDTGGSVLEAVELVQSKGARDVYVSCVHPVLSMNASQRIANAPIKRLITTDSIPIPPEKWAHLEGKTSVISVAPLLGEVIRRAHEGRSVGEMFNE
jgi:ribose-phosphate pyrophosphokinase